MGKMTELLLSGQRRMGHPMELVASLGVIIKVGAAGSPGAGHVGSLGGNFLEDLVGV